MTQYLLSVFPDDAEMARLEDPEALATMYADTGRLNERLKEAGAFVFAGGLHAASTATVVRNANPNGEAIMTDGPYIEAKEVLGGFWIIEAEDLDAALAWAKDGSAACNGPVEVRPFQ